MKMLSVLKFLLCMFLCHYVVGWWAISFVLNLRSLASLYNKKFQFLQISKVFTRTEWFSSRFSVSSDPNLGYMFQFELGLRLTISMRLYDHRKSTPRCVLGIKTHLKH